MHSFQTLQLHSSCKDPKKIQFIKTSNSFKIRSEKKGQNTQIQFVLV